MKKNVIIFLIVVFFSIMLFISCMPKEEYTMAYLSLQSLFDMTPLVGHNNVSYTICMIDWDTLMIPGEGEYEGWYVFNESFGCFYRCEGADNNGSIVTEEITPGVYDWGILVDTDGNGLNETDWIDLIKPEDGGLKHNQYSFEKGKVYDVVITEDGRTVLTVSNK